MLRYEALGRFGEHDEFVNMGVLVTLDAVSYVNGDVFTINDDVRCTKAAELGDLFFWTDEKWDSLNRGRKCRYARIRTSWPFSGFQSNAAGLYGISDHR